jgi:two-component system response regulator HydG
MGHAKPMQILVADDEPSMRITLAAILRAEGYEVDTTADGLAAVEQCLRKAYDVVILDVRMPGLDGVEAFRRLRLHQKGARVFLMSAYGVDDLKQLALEEGVVAFLDKPLDIDKVIRLIQESQETTILVVADDTSTAATLGQVLTAQGYRVTVVQSPHAALELIEQIRFDILFIDVQLPAMNGLDLYLAIKRVTSTTVAIMITGMEAEFERLAREAVRQTAYTFIRKPLDVDHLLGLLLRLKRQRISDALRKPAEEIGQ